MENNVVAKSNKKLIAIILVAIIAAVGVYFVFLKKNSSPKSIFTKAINKGYEKFMSVDLGETKSDKPVVVDQKLSFDIDIDKSIIGAEGKEAIDELNKLGLNVKTAVDPKESNAIVGFGATYDKADLLNLAVYLTKNKGYIELKDLLDKYIEVDLEGQNLFATKTVSSLTEKDAKYVVKAIKDALIDSVDEKDFKKEKDEIEVNGKDTKVSKITLGISQKDANKIAQKFIKNIKNDSKLIKILAKETNASEKEIKEALNEALEELQDAKDLDTEDVIIVSVYAKGNNPIGFGIEAQDAEITIVEDTKNKSTITIRSGVVAIPIVLEKIEKGNTKEYKLSIDYQGVTGSISIKSEEIKKDKEYKLTLIVKAMNMVDAKITDEIKVEYKDKLDMPDFKNTVKAENISEEDYNKIMTKLSNNKAFMEFAKALEK